MKDIKDYIHMYLGCETNQGKLTGINDITAIVTFKCGYKFRGPLNEVKPILRPLTSPHIRITETGSVEYHPNYPVEPALVYDDAYAHYLQACKEAESGFIPVTNKEYAQYFLAKNYGYDKNTMNTKPGLYPYTGEVSYDITGSKCILVEPKPEVKELSPTDELSVEYQKVCRLAKKLKEENDKVRESYEGLIIANKELVEALNDARSIIRDNVPGYKLTVNESFKIERIKNLITKHSNL